jgi:hypothetical protein
MISSKDEFMQQREFEQEEDLSMFNQTEQDRELENIFDNPLATVPQLLRDTTKEDRQNFVESILESIEMGDVDALKIQVQIKNYESMMEMFSDVKKFPNTASRYKKYLMEAAGKYGKKFELYNCEFSEKEAGVKYSYDKCNDSEMDQLLAQQEAIKAAIDVRAKFLKTVPTKGLEIVDKATGDCVTIYPPAKSSTTIIQTVMK